ncbi:MAG: hypothetical protein WC767_00540 [Candidatus Paceibacterota bacterium]|jgi:hypothetical protein
MNMKAFWAAFVFLAFFSWSAYAQAESGRDAAKTESKGAEVDLKEIDDIDAEIDVDVDLDNLDDADKVEDVDIEDDEDEDLMDDKFWSKLSDVSDKLDDLADEDSDVREVSKEWKEAEGKITEGVKKVQERDGFKTLLIGTDYKTLGELRSTVITTENHIDRLEKAVERSRDAQVKLDLEAQIQALRETASTTEVFIRDNEGKFSLLGWFVRIFAD